MGKRWKHKTNRHELLRELSPKLFPGNQIPLHVPAHDARLDARVVLAPLRHPPVLPGHGHGPRVPDQVYHPDLDLVAHGRRDDLGVVERRAVEERAGELEPEADGLGGADLVDAAGARVEARVKAEGDEVAADAPEAEVVLRQPGELTLLDVAEPSAQVFVS